MFPTRFTELTGCNVPLQVAPMGTITTPDLIEAVARVGAHGMFGAAGQTAATLGPVIDRLEGVAGRRYGINFLIPFLDEEAVEFAASKAPVIDFYHGDPDRRVVEIAKKGGALVGWQINTRAEAVEAVDAGCDFVIAHGSEAGGRNPAEIGLFPLLTQVLDAVNVPVVAAGGIGDARGIVAALAAGADGVRLGTRFVASRESGAHPRYVDALIKADTGDTVMTDAFSAGWPGGPANHRVLRSALDAASASQKDVVGEMKVGDAVVPVARFGFTPANANIEGDIEAMALYAGESVGAVTRVQPAAEIVEELMQDVEALLRRVPMPEIPTP